MESNTLDTGNGGQIYMNTKEANAKGIMYMNIASLRAKYNNFCNELLELKTKPKIIALQETWDPLANQINIEGYQTLIQTKMIGGSNAGGGIGYFIKFGIKFRKEAWSPFHQNCFESLTIKL